MAPPESRIKIPNVESWHGRWALSGEEQGKETCGHSRSGAVSAGRTYFSGVQHGQPQERLPGARRDRRTLRGTVTKPDSNSRHTAGFSVQGLLPRATRLRCGCRLGYCAAERGGRGGRGRSPQRRPPRAEAGVQKLCRSAPECRRARYAASARQARGVVAARSAR